MRKLLAYTILAGMTLHCAGRLGFLDQLYQQRNDIAFALGLIKEVPISVCSSDYDFNDNLKFESHPDTDATVPVLSHTHDINLFFISEYHHSASLPILLSSPRSAALADLYKLTLFTSIFHPPTV